METYFSIVQKACLPGVWSRGVSLSREGAVTLDSRKADELALRVASKDRAVAAKVSLYPEDEDWHCDCGDRANPCAHVAAAVIALKAGAVGASDAKSEASQTRIEYRFSRAEGDRLALERWLVWKVKQIPLRETLVAAVGGIQSGRIALPVISATQGDFAIDGLLGSGVSRIPDASVIARILAQLEDNGSVLLDSAKIRCSPRLALIRARVQDEGQGFRLRIEEEAGKEITRFSNGAALVGDELRPYPLDGAEQRKLASLFGEGRLFPAQEGIRLAEEILPVLGARMPLEIETSRLPKRVSAPPRIVLEFRAEEDGSLVAISSLVYGDPPVAAVRGDRLEGLAPGVIVTRDLTRERDLARRLHVELRLVPGQWARLEGEAAAQFVERAKKFSDTGDCELRGAGTGAFALRSALIPRIELNASGGMSLKFENSDGSVADPSRVWEAFARGESLVPLLGGAWAPLPKDWMERYGARLESFLAHKTLPQHLVPAVADLLEETGQPVPIEFSRLRKALEAFEGIPQAPLPIDLRAELRSYQRAGVNWLHFLRGSGMGAMLADDMGLGKTLQAICVFKGRTLVVAPTSVLQNWVSQIAAFRPVLKTSVYHGPSRRIDSAADVTITSYAILRLDIERLGAQKWDTILIDEAQVIKNPDSQVARTVHSLEAPFKIALTGTPVENRLEDLWSQFQFLNPGLLGSREDFQSEFAARGNTAGLRRRIKPFILRRMKREVASELPPKTESVLECELSPTERDTYDAILASGRKEVLDALQAGASIFAALELLLRLRQACCHLALLPGQGADSSAKLDLLLDALETSIGLGHRSLVFSQWTGYLDLIQKKLSERGIAFTRLDGSTPNRGEVVERFQAPDGPPVMLISLKAGGVGLNLTAADHVYIMDPWWNPAVEDQAADRVHRIGQRQPVTVYRLVAKDTIEERILELQRKKQALASAILEDAAAAAALTRENLLDLLR